MRKSFKKGMAMLLAAAMVFSTPVALDGTTAKAAANPVVVTESSTTPDEVDCSTGYFTGFSNYYKAKGNFEATFNMTLKGAVKKDDKYQNWYAPLLVIASDVDRAPAETAEAAGYVEYAVRRADQYGWGESNTAMTKDWFTADAEKGIDSAVDWATWLDKMVVEGTKYSVNIKRVADTFTVTYGMEAGGKKYSMIEEITKKSKDFPDTLRIFFSGENNKFTIDSYTYKEAEGIANGLLGDIEAKLSEDGKKINLTYNTKVEVPVNDISIKVNGAHVASGAAVTAGTATGAATYVYTPDKDGEYKFTVTALDQTIKGEKYLEQTVTATVKVKKEGEKYVYDADLFEGFKAEEGSEGLNITWKALNGATVSAKVTGGGKTINLTTPRTVKFSELTAGTKYTVTLTATKAGYATKTATADYTYSTKFEAYTVGTIDKKTAFWKAFSKPYQINDKKTRVVEMEVHGGAALYHNFVLAFANQENFDEATRGSAYTEYAAVRTDKWGWGGGDNKSLCGKDIQYVSHSLVSGGKTMKMGDTGFDAAFIAIMDSANATVEVARSGKMLEITMKIASTKNAKNVITSVTRLELGTKDGKDNGTGKVFMRIVPDMSYFIVKNVTEKAAGEIKPPTDPKPPVVSAKVSKVSITVPNRKAGKTVYMKKGDKVTLKATVTGFGSYSKSVTWKSSKTKIATVKNGKVTAKKAGTAKITATSKTDKSKKATITIKVSKKAVKNKVLKISPTKKTLKKGKSLTIKIKKITKKTTDKITYKSSKKSVATVDAYGKVKAKKKGKATITVKCGKKSAKLKLTVKK